MAPPGRRQIALLGTALEVLARRSTVRREKTRNLTVRLPSPMQAGASAAFRRSSRRQPVVPVPTGVRRREDHLEGDPGGARVRTPSRRSVWAIRSAGHRGRNVGPGELGVGLEALDLALLREEPSPLLRDGHRRASRKCGGLGWERKGLDGGGGRRVEGLLHLRDYPGRGTDVLRASAGEDLLPERLGEEKRDENRFGHASLDVGGGGGGS